MEITPKDNTINIDAYVNQIQQNRNKPAETAKQAADPAVKTDTVEISATGKRIVEAKKQLEAIPDVQQDKVDRLKSQIENGTYEINAEKIADRMLRESLFNDMD